MKAGLHPEYYVVTAKCSCGNTFVTRSTKKTFTLDICSNCHPFFTGKERFVDAEGRIDKFLKKFEKSKTHKEKVTADKKKEEAEAKAKVKKAASRIETSTGTKKTTVKVLTSRPKS